MSDQSIPLKALFDLSGQVAVVTGGSRGLGLQIAEALTEYGATVIITARKTDELDAAVKHLIGLGGKAVSFAGDFGKPEEIARFIDWIAANHKGVDILVNNAGTTWGAPAEDHPLEAWDKVMALNLTAPFLLTQAIGKTWMIPRGYGRIVNVASIAGLQGQHHAMDGMIAYSTSKGGMVNFTRALAGEWGRFGITVNALAPGYFPSKMTKITLQRHEADLVAGTPLGKLGGANDLKGLALLFSSAAGGHVTGQIVAIDGGATII